LNYIINTVTLTYGKTLSFYINYWQIVRAIDIHKHALAELKRFANCTRNLPISVESTVKNYQLQSSSQL